MQTSLEVLFTPADFARLPERDLSQTWCVVFDVLRATSSMVTALANGARAIWPVEEIAQALAIRERQPEVLLAGERDGLRIRAAQTGSIDFDLGNSPREFVPEKVAGKTVVMTTTNGTRGLRSCANARQVLAACLLNLDATAELILRERPARVLIVCSGTFEETAYEDVLGAGALCDRIWSRYEGGAIADSALMALNLYRLEQDNLLQGLARSRNGRRLVSRPDLAADVAFCAQVNALRLVARLAADGQVRSQPLAAA